MKTLLLDTHTVLWFWWDDPRLSADAKAHICEPANRKLVSIASPWEVAIKVSRKKARHRRQLSRFLRSAHDSHVF